MRFANVRELKLKTADLLEAVADGEEIVITYNGRPRAVLMKITEEDLRVEASKRLQFVLKKGHPFLKLIGKARDSARDVSANKYKYVALAARKKR
jgi:prevent-host-death family protein